MFPRWMSLLVLGFFAYLLFVGTQRAPVETSASAPIIPAIEPHTYPALAEATDLERWKRAINPDYAERTQCKFAALESDVPLLGLKVIEESAGQGAPAKCGETITVKLTVWNGRGKIARVEEALPVTLGMRDIAAGLDAGLLGLRPGGSRTLILPPGALMRSKKATVPTPLVPLLKGQNVLIVTAERGV